MNNILLMSYGSQERVEDVEEYLSGIFNNRAVPEEVFKENLAKYRMVNGISPSNKIIKNIRDKLSKLLQKYGDFDVTIVYKHWKPDISAGIQSMKNEYENIIALPLFPFKSNNNKKSYEIPFMDAIQRNNIRANTIFINGLDNKMFNYIWMHNISKYMYDFENVLFAAHSLPLVDDETEYKNSIFTKIDELSELFNPSNVFKGFYGNNRYGKWLPPFIYDLKSQIVNKKIDNLLIIPVGFLYEHLEILYDLDVKYREFIENLGIKYGRVETPSSSDELVILLTNVIMKNL